MEPIERSVIPLDEIGVLDLMEGETELADGHQLRCRRLATLRAIWRLLLSSGKERAHVCRGYFDQSNACARTLICRLPWIRIQD